MGELKGFMRTAREAAPERAPAERAHDYKEFALAPQLPLLRAQGGRCMDCGVPFCHSGCPLGNLIPDWNDLVYRDHWQEAITQLHRTNNFPEFTGRLCPAPCEAACVLEINEGEAVTIKNIENAIIDRAFAEDWVRPQPPTRESGREIAIVGSGPAGMACAQQLRRAGHGVVVFERDEAAGGLVRFGVPDFKIEKWVVQRRVEQLEDEGVRFRFNTDVGIDITAEELQADFDAVVLAVGARTPRDLAVAGRELTGIHFAMEYLYARNRWAASEFGPAPSAHAPAVNPVSARGKNVVVIGGGDTGADCVGQATREGAKAILQLELVPEPPLQRVDARTPWPLWPNKLRLSYAMKEVQALSRGGLDFSVVTTHLSGEDGKVQTLHVANADTQPPFAAIAGSEREHAADLVLLAMGFVHPQHEGLLTDLGVELDARGNVSAHAHASSVKGVFAAGDVRRGQSLIVWAINEGRECAQAVEHYLATSPTATS